MRATLQPSRDPEQTWAGDPAHARVARRSTLASIAVALVLLGVGGFAVWTSQITSGAARTAHDAILLSDDYASAAVAVAAEESLERKYRLEPGPAVREKFDAAAAVLLSSLGSVSRDGAPADQARADQVLAAHREYRSAMVRMFAAVDAGDTPTVLRIDAGEADPAFEAIAVVVDEAAESHRASALLELAHLAQVEVFSRRVTPAVFLVGLLVAATLASVTRGYRRLLDAERSRAIHDSLHDGLTGLPNRALLVGRSAEALLAAQGAGVAVGLLLVDLDRFKEINDTFGHDHGDKLLTQIGPRLRSVLGEQDTVARTGGDEFAVLLPNIADLAAATTIAARLHVALEAPFEVDGVALDVEASVGVVLSGVHGGDVATLLQRVDIAMDVAKTQSLGIFVYTPEIDGFSPARLSLLGELRRALDLGQLVLHYQPQVALSTGHLVGVEALVRWRHPERGLIFPDDFIPVAERTAVIGPLTAYVLDAALAQARTWLDARQPLTVSVNLSARNLLDERLPDQVAGLLVAHGVPAELLQLEVTESAIMTEPARALRVLEALAALGVRLSIDDFGAGFTSLSQLKSLPVAELKIDRTFVTTMMEDTRDALIVRSVVELGHNLGLTIVAEGVETAAAFEALTGFGCDVAQGYYLSRALSVEALDQWRDARGQIPAQSFSARSGRRPT